jgi:hypothetical protein
MVGRAAAVVNEYADIALRIVRALERIADALTRAYPVPQRAAVPPAPVADGTYWRTHTRLGRRAYKWHRVRQSEGWLDPDSGVAHYVYHCECDRGFASRYDERVELSVAKPTTGEYCAALAKVLATGA